VAEVRQRFPRCRIVVNPRNLGFGQGCNVGIETALREGFDFILLLNQDTVIDAGLPGALVNHLLDRPAAGVVGPKTYFQKAMPDGRQKLLYAGAWRGLLPLRQKLPGIEQPDSDAFRGPCPVDYVWGHGMLLRAEAIREVGVFDPGFFMYYEDLDLCRRMKAAGYEIWFEPAAVMWHDISDGARAKASEKWRWFQKVRSTRYYHRKYYNRPAAAMLSILTILAEAQQLLRKGRFSAVHHLLSAYLMTMFREKEEPGAEPR